VYCYVEFVCKVYAKDGVVWVVEVYHIEGDVFCPCVLLISEGYWK
jgi:hypothetical protein